MLLPVQDLKIIVSDKYIVDLKECRNCGRAIMHTGKHTITGWTHWGFDSTRCPDLDDGRPWEQLPKAEPSYDKEQTNVD